MTRECPHCHNPLAPQDLSKGTSKEMEAERRALGLEGVRFRFYTCSRCGHDDIFLDVLPLPGEGEADFRARRESLGAAVRQLHADRTVVVVVEK